MKSKKRKRKYNWLQISLYFIVLCLEELVNLFKKKSTKMKIVKASWIVVDIYGIAILISQPFCMWNSTVLNSALWGYVIAAIISFGLCTKESINYLFDQIIGNKNNQKDQKEEIIEYEYNHGYNIIDIQDYIDVYADEKHKMLK